jgi:hypothetical protein
MGGAAMIFLLLTGVILGAIAGVLVAQRSKARPAVRAALGIAAFAVCLALPLGLFVVGGVFARHASPQPPVAPAVAPGK